jgi:hypothetical protein
MNNWMTISMSRLRQYVAHSDLDNNIQEYGLASILFALRQVRASMVGGYRGQPF